MSGREADSSPELTAAYKELAASIQKVSALVDLEDEQTILTDWVVLAATTRFDGDGNAISGVRWMMEEPGMSWHSLIGLIRTASVLVERRFGEREDDEQC